MIRSHLLSLIILAGGVLAASAHDFTPTPSAHRLTLVEPAATGSFTSPSSTETASTVRDRNIFNHLSAGVTVGSTGIGIDVSTHVTDWVRLRVGANWMPKFAVPFDFSVSSYSNAGLNGASLDRLKEMMLDFTGIQVDDEIKMDGTANLWNFKFLVDIYPWQADRRWRITTGFYVGSNKIGKAVNNLDEAPSLVAMNIYNRFYDIAASDNFMEPEFMGFNMTPDMREKFIEKGQMGIHVGDYAERDENGNVVPYMMKPGSDGKVQAWALVNRFRPYLGFGFGSPVAHRCNLDVDLGVMLWGGRPRIVTHEGVDLTNDVVNIQGRPGDYVDLIKKFSVYPVLSVRFSFDCF